MWRADEAQPSLWENITQSGSRYPNVLAHNQTIERAA